MADFTFTSEIRIESKLSQKSVKHGNYQTNTKVK